MVLQWFCFWYKWFFDVFLVRQPLVFQWFPMLANHWSYDALVTIHHYGLVSDLNISVLFFVETLMLTHRIPYFDARISDCLKKEDTVLRLARDNQVKKCSKWKSKEDQIVSSDVNICTYVFREFFWALSSLALWMQMTRRRRRRTMICRGGENVLKNCTSMKEIESNVHLSLSLVLKRCMMLEKSYMLEIILARCKSQVWRRMKVMLTCI